MGDSSYPFRARDSQIGLSVYDTCYNSASATVNFDVASNEKVCQHTCTYYKNWAQSLTFVYLKPLNGYFDKQCSPR